MHQGVGPLKWRKEHLSSSHITHYTISILHSRGWSSAIAPIELLFRRSVETGPNSHPKSGAAGDANPRNRNIERAAPNRLRRLRIDALRAGALAELGREAEARAVAREAHPQLLLEYGAAHPAVVRVEGLLR